ncbi:hypothetical protein M0R45_026190 [Rubus argutus]|uniref:Uncharacterized protein n=1 Tax=Rubus argutus TaxID=59490 RepID=A0AAW1WYF4_RUBAR
MESPVSWVLQKRDQGRELWLDSSKGRRDDTGIGGALGDGVGGLGTGLCGFEERSMMALPAVLERAGAAATSFSGDDDDKTERRGVRPGRCTAKAWLKLGARCERRLRCGLKAGCFRVCGGRCTERVARINWARARDGKARQVWAGSCNGDVKRKSELV